MFHSHPTVTWVYAVWNALQVFDRQMSSRLLLRVRFEWEITLFIFWWPSKEAIFVSHIQSVFPLWFRPLAMSVFWAANVSDVVQVMLLPVSQSEEGREGYFDRTCKSILLSCKQRLISQWRDGCWVVGSRPQI